MKLNLSQNNAGLRFDTQQNPDINNKLTYQQLLSMNHDLSKQNIFLKIQSRRLGDQLKNLHTQFDLKPPLDENNQIYDAISSAPHLHKYQSTLVPLFDAYQYKIQQFQREFETIHEEYFTLEKKFTEICHENENLKQKITTKIKQVIQVYRNGSNQQIQSDFGEIILCQINQKQKYLVQQNIRLDRDVEKYRSQCEKLKNEETSNTKCIGQLKSKVKQQQIRIKSIQSENKSLKQSTFELQIKLSEIQNEKRVLDNAHDRSQSVNNYLNKQRQMYQNRYQQLKYKLQQDGSNGNGNGNQIQQNKKIQELQNKIAFLEAQLGPNDGHKKLSKLQKQYDSLNKQKQRLKQTIDQSKIREQELNSSISQLKDQISKISSQNSSLKINQQRINKSLQTLNDKLKNDILKTKKDAQDSIQKIDFEYRHKIQIKDRKILEVEDALEKLKYEKQRIQKQFNFMNESGESKGKHSTKDSERVILKMKEKITLTEEVFKQQLQILENDMSYLKQEAEKYKEQAKNKGDQLRKLRNQYEQVKKQYDQVCGHKATLVQEFKRVRNQYEIHLKDKQLVFDDKIKQFRIMVQDAENKRKIERERVQEATKEYKRVLQGIQNAYEARIRELQAQISKVEYSRPEMTVGR